MGMLKTIGWGHRVVSDSENDESTKDGKKRSDVDLQDYLAFGDDVTHTQIKDYLEHGHGHIESRVRAFRCSDNLLANENSWASRMRSTRLAWGKDSGRTYGHFTISPDPRDRVSAAECADVAAEWAARRYPGAQWVVVVHDDNANNIVHAHIVLNSVYPDTGRKIHDSDEDVDKNWDTLQDICESHGLRDLPEAAEYRRRKAEGKLTEQAAWRTRAERAAAARGESWVADIRGAIDSCAAEASDWQDFVRRFNARGFRITRARATRGGLVFHHPQGTCYTMRVSAARLGTQYTEKALRARLVEDFDSVWRNAQTRRPVSAGLIAALQSHNVHTSWSRRPVTLQEWVDQALAGRSDYERLASSFSALGALSDEHILYYDELVDRIERLRAEVADEKATLLDMKTAATAAARLGEDIANRASLMAELDAIEAATKGAFPLDVDTRKRRKELEARLGELDESINKALARGASYLAAQGLAEAPDADKAAALVEMLQKIADEESGRLDELEKRYRALVRAQAAFDDVQLRIFGVMLEHSRLEKKESVPHGPRKRMKKRSGWAKSVPLTPQQARLLAALLEQNKISDSELVEIAPDPDALWEALEAAKPEKDEKGNDIKPTKEQLDALKELFKTLGALPSVADVNDFLNATHAVNEVDIDKEGRERRGTYRPAAHPKDVWRNQEETVQEDFSRREEGFPAAARASAEARAAAPRTTYQSRPENRSNAQSPKTSARPHYTPRPADDQSRNLQR